MTNSIGVLLDNESMYRWQLQALETAVNDCDVSIDLAVISEVNTDNRENNTDVLNDLTLWNLYRTYHRQITSTPDFRERVCLDRIPFISDTDIEYSKIIDRDGLGNELPQDTVRSLSTVDVVIRFGFGILVGEALNAPKHGIVSFHHGDLTEYRGRPAGFWEFVNREQTAGVTLQLLTESLDGGEIIEIKRVDISEASSWLETQELLFNASNDMLATAFNQLPSGGFNTENPNEIGILYKNPKLLGMIRYFYSKYKRKGHH